MTNHGAAWRFLAAITLTLITSACDRGRNTIFIIDTSGSMKKDQLIAQVKTSAHRILNSARNGDKVVVYAFDTEPRQVASVTVSGPQDLTSLLDRINGLEAKGQWTDLQEALDQSLATTTELLKQNRSRKTVLVLYTDGQDDPPPGQKRGRKLDFDELFRKYYTAGATGSWFMYYVELGKPAPELKRLLETTGAGQTITRSEFLGDLDIITASARKTWIKYGSWILGGAALLLLVMFFIRAWALRGTHLVSLSGHSFESGGPDADMVWLGNRPLVMFKFFVNLGSNAEVKITGPGVDPKHARIKTSVAGRYFLKPVSEGTLKVDGMPIQGEVEIKPGQKIQLGDREFEFRKTKK